MHDTDTNDPNPAPRRRRWFGLAHQTAASWSGRAPNGASSALAPAPGVAGEAGRQGAPELEVGAAEGSSTLGETTGHVTNSATPYTEPLADARAEECPYSEQPSWREPDAPPLPALMNRKRTTEKRDQEKKIRFTRTAVRIIAAEAGRRGMRFAGFVGDAALAVALGKTSMVGSPEDDPIRPLVEAVEAHTTALNRIGTNLNQITGAIHRGAISEHTEQVLDRVDQAVEQSYQLLDHLLADGVSHGA